MDEDHLLHLCLLLFDFSHTVVPLLSHLVCSENASLASSLVQWRKPLKSLTSLWSINFNSFLQILLKKYKLTDSIKNSYFCQEQVVLEIPPIHAL